jgi:triacylglycerol lipase
MKGYHWSQRPVAERNPVILVHGIFDTGNVFDALGQYLAVRGYEAWSLDLAPSDGRDGLEALASQLAEFRNSSYLAGRRVNLVGFSMGGLVSRYFLQRLGGHTLIDTFVSISSPHYGTRLGQSALNRGIAQMAPGSPFLVDLNRDFEALRPLRITSIYTSRDLVIFPYTSSRFEIGTNIELPVLTHPWMLRDPRALRAVDLALRQ